MKTFRHFPIVLLIAVSFCCPTAATALTIWDGPVNGDLSYFNDAPTDLFTLHPGGDEIFGSRSEGFDWLDSADVAKFVVPSGYLLSQFILETYDDRGSFGYASGPQPAGVYTFRFGPISEAGVSGLPRLYSLALNVTPVPEPAVILLFGTGLAGLAGMARRKKKR